MLEIVEQEATPTPTTRVLHFADIDSGAYRRRSPRKPTWCGTWATERELATHRDLITCPTCAEHLEHFTQMDI
jgi:hypothetical protein